MVSTFAYFTQNLEKEVNISDDFVGYPTFFYSFIIVGSIMQFFFWICFACCIGDDQQRPEQNQISPVTRVTQQSIPTITIIKGTLKHTCTLQ